MRLRGFHECDACVGSTDPVLVAFPRIEGDGNSLRASPTIAEESHFRGRKFIGRRLMCETLIGGVDIAMLTKVDCTVYLGDKLK